MLVKELHTADIYSADLLQLLEHVCIDQAGEWRKQTVVVITVSHFHHQ